VVSNLNHIAKAPANRYTSCKGIFIPL
jgi:hypothetical protein